MRNFKSPKKLGFTMSEVLIVLAILGFVAAIILGVIRINSVKQFAAGRSLFTSDLANALSIMNTEHPLAEFSATDNSEDFVKTFFDYYNIIKAKDFNTKHEIFAMDSTGENYKIKDLNGDQVTLKKYDRYFVTNNGVSVALSYVKADTILPKFVPDQSRISTSGESYEMASKALDFVTGVYDLNGTKGPNVLGRDIGIIMPYYPLNEKAGEYFASTNDGTFFVAKKDGSTPRGGSDIRTPDGETPGGVCPPGQSMTASGVCMPPSDEPGACSPRPAEHSCKGINPGFSVTEGGTDSNGCKIYQCECTRMCSNGQHADSSCKCPEDDKKECGPQVACSPGYAMMNPANEYPNCSYCVPEEDKSLDCKPAGSSSIGNYTNCKTGAAFECTNSGGTWDSDTCVCSCKDKDKENYNSDTCHLRGAYCDSESVSCKASCPNSSSTGVVRNGLTRKLPREKATYYTVSKTDNYDQNCFNYTPATSNANVVFTRSVTDYACEINVDCNDASKGLYTPIGQALPTVPSAKTIFSGITNHIDNACKWSCDLNEYKAHANNPDSVSVAPTTDAGGIGLWKWTGLTKESNSCSWGCPCSSQYANGTTDPNNPNWVYVNDLNACTCYWSCNQPAKPSCGFGQDSSWTSGDANNRANTCKWSGCTCQLDANMCKSYAETCGISVKGNTTSCTTLEYFKDLVHDNWNTTNFYGSGWRKCGNGHLGTDVNNGVLLRPIANGFPPYHQNYSVNGGRRPETAYFACTANGGTLRQASTSYRTCKAKLYVDISYGVTSDCKCAVNLATNDSKKPINQTYTFEGWYNTGAGGIATEDAAFQDASCTYSVSSTRSGTSAIDIGNSSTIITGKNGVNYYCSNNAWFTVGGSYNLYSEACNHIVDPIIFITQQGESANELPRKFLIQEDRGLDLGNGEKSHWLDNDHIATHPFLIKLSDDGSAVLNRIGSWPDIQNLMFTDLFFNSGVTELRDLTKASDYLNAANNKWNTLGVAIVDVNGNVRDVKTLSDYGISEIYLPTVTSGTAADRSNDAVGAIGDIKGCYRKGVGEGKPLCDIVGKYVRKINRNAVEYHKVIQNEDGSCALEAGATIETANNSSGMYVYNNGKCTINTNLAGKTYVKIGDLYYLEAALPFVDVLLKSTKVSE